uniref:DUF4219 domain-containing protein n=2 Tax=Triticum urartu TaxID=4572 RepID=A0A8R7QWU1_TRIUA
MMKLGFNTLNNLLKLHIFQQSRKPLFEEMPSRSDVIKPDVFDGTNFNRWQAKTKMWLMDQKLFWTMADPPRIDPMDAECQTKWKDADTPAVARLLSVFADKLFDVYVSYMNANKLWDELDQKYSKGDNGNESFITARYLNYKMVDGCSVMERIHEL